MKPSNEDEPTCLYCGQPLGYGRKDRKFCCNSCRINYNNSRRAGYYSVQTRVITTLRRNYSLLQETMDSGEDSVDLDDLVQMGFNPEIATSYRKLNRGLEYRCFDIRYRRSASRIFQICHSKKQ